MTVLAWSRVRCVLSGAPDERAVYVVGELVAIRLPIVYSVLDSGPGSFHLWGIS